MKKSGKLLIAASHCQDEFHFTRQYWVDPLKKFFKEIVFFDPQIYLLHEGRETLNKKFIQLIKKEQPDFIFFWLLDDEYTIESLAKIRELSPKTKTINFFGDSDTKIDNFCIQYSLFMDYNLFLPHLKFKEYEKRKIQNVFYTCGTNLDHFKPLNLKKKYDVTFIGTPKVESRYPLLKHLKDNGISLRIYGHGWGDYKDLDDIYMGPLNQDDYVKIANQSKINLCFTKNYLNKSNHLVGRFFEVGACKAFQLLEHSPRFLDLFKEGKEAITFEGKQDLLKKVKYYLKHEKEREEAAENTYKRILKDYDLVKELESLFKKAFKEKNKPPKKLPKLDKKIVAISEKDIKLSSEKLKQILKDADYIYFKKGWSRSTAYREYIQAYTLEILKKDISCCDCYICDNNKVPYLLFRPCTAFDRYGEKIAAPLVDINQLMVTKKYFLENINKFKKMFKGGKADFMNKQNTALIHVSLVDIDTLRKAEDMIMKKSFRPIYLNHIRVLAHQKKLFTDPYLYRLIFFSLFGKTFILKNLYEYASNKHRLKALKQSYKK